MLRARVFFVCCLLSSASLQARLLAPFTIDSASVDGAVLTIDGSNFGTAAGKVTLASHSLTIRSWSNTRITTDVPTLVAGTYIVTVTRQHTGNGIGANAVNSQSMSLTIGAAGAPGPPGPALSSINALGGLPCTLPAGITGQVSVNFGLDGSINLRCELPQPPPPQPYCLDPLPQTDEIANAAFAVFSQARQVTIPGSCYGTVAIACPNGQPSTASFTMTPTAATITQGAQSGTYDFSLTFTAFSNAGIPIKTSGLECTFNFDTSASGPPATTITGTFVFDSHTATGAGSVNEFRPQAIQTTVDALDNADITSAAGFACNLSANFVGVVRGTLSAAIADAIATPICKQCGASAYGDCGPYPQ